MTYVCDGHVTITILDKATSQPNPKIINASFYNYIYLLTHLKYFYLLIYFIVENLQFIYFLYQMKRKSEEYFIFLRSFLIFCIHTPRNLLIIYILNKS